MRISADSRSPHFYSQAMHAAVYLDGKPLTHCVTADEEAGTVECLALDVTGRVLHDGDKAELVTLRGRVSIFIDGENFDAWMRRRADVAHAEFMARGAAGGVAYAT